MTWVQTRLKEYAKGKRQLETARKALPPDDPDDVQLAGMISDMAYAINWMRSGHPPGVYRGIERRGVYREPYVLDKDLFPSLQEPDAIRPFRLTAQQRQTALEAIRAMSDRERDCYLLHVAQGLSEYKIAAELRLSRSTVQTNIKRAKNKVESLKCYDAQGV